jgi:hypothetical protein
MKNFKIGGTTIEHNLCSCLDCRIEDKKFGLLLREIGSDRETYNVSLTHIKIMEAINESINTEIIKYDDEPKVEYCIVIDTPTHRIFVDIPKVRE